MCALMHYVNFVIAPIAQWIRLRLPSEFTSSNPMYSIYALRSIIQKRKKESYLEKV